MFTAIFTILILFWFENISLQQILNSLQKKDKNLFKLQLHQIKNEK